MNWTFTQPTKPGWYWHRNLKNKIESDPHILFIRNYAGELASGNSHLSNWESSHERSNEPIEMPKEK